jgi:hypothetical protein
MHTLNIRVVKGKKYVYLVKRSKRPENPKSNGRKLVDWYLGPVNDETLADLIEGASRLMLHLSEKKNVPGARIWCPVCKTPVSKLGIEEIVASRLFEKLKEMEETNEDVYQSEEYETLKLVAETLTK